MNTYIDPLLDVVVAKHGEHEFTKRELLAHFDQVADSDNWKNPIDGLADLPTKRDRAAMHEAVIFFTGSTPKIVAHKDRFRVIAAGYYVAVGA